MSLRLDRGVPLARRMVTQSPVRVAITMAGVGVAVMMMLFLFALYEGVRTESNGYVADRPITAWVAQTNTTSFIKSQSLVPMALGDTVRRVQGVAEATPLARLVSLLEIGGGREAAIVVGLDPASTAGRPTIVAGSDQLKPGDIILDRALARRFHVSVGDSLRLQGDMMHVIGLSSGTNVVLAHLAFITHHDAASLFGVPGVTSYFLVRAAVGVSAPELVQRLRTRLPGWTVLSQAEFADHNMAELRGGLLPILSTVAVLGALDAAAVLALLLYGAVLERREDYAVLKAIGASDRMLAWLVVRQALAAAVGGLVMGLIAYAGLSPLVLAVVPQMLLAVSGTAVALVAAGTIVIGTLGALWPLRRVSLIHPGEVFRT